MSKSKKLTAVLAYVDNLGQLAKPYANDIEELIAEVRQEERVRFTKILRQCAVGVGGQFEKAEKVIS